MGYAIDHCGLTTEAKESLKKQKVSFAVVVTDRAKQIVVGLSTGKDIGSAHELGAVEVVARSVANKVIARTALIIVGKAGLKTATLVQSVASGQDFVGLSRGELDREGFLEEVYKLVGQKVEFQNNENSAPVSMYGGIEVVALALSDNVLDNGAAQIAADMRIDLAAVETQVASDTLADLGLATQEKFVLRAKTVMARARQIIAGLSRGRGSGPVHEVVAVEIVARSVASGAIYAGAQSIAGETRVNLAELKGHASSRHISSC